MQLRPVDPETAPEPLGGYTQAMEVSGASRLLFVSGQVPQSRAVRRLFEPWDEDGRQFPRRHDAR